MRTPGLFEDCGARAGLFVLGSQTRKRASQCSMCACKRSSCLVPANDRGLRLGSSLGRCPLRRRACLGSFSALSGSSSRPC
jgi:hypothetical protein